MKSRRIEFRAPTGATPEGVQDGEEFDLVCTFRVKGPNVCLVEMGDQQLPGYSQDTHSDAYVSEAKNMMSLGSSGEGA